MPEVGLKPTRGCGALPNETSASTLATEIMLRSSEEWALIATSRRKPSKRQKIYRTIFALTESPCR